MAGPPDSHSQRRQRQVIAALVSLVVVATVAVFALGGSDGDVKAGPAPTTVPTTTTTTTAAVPQPATTATTKVASLQVFDRPATGATVVTSLSDTTEYGLPRTLLVTEQQPGWLHVLLPIRPNGSTGWVRDTEVAIATTLMSIKIELAAHKVTLYNAGKVVLESAAVIGKKETPTPPGSYYVTDPVDLQLDPNSEYGAFAIGISGFSEVLKSFNGGPGQLALHGTPRPEQVGQDVSNGCVRVPNDVIVQISKLAPLGTPVTIVA